jgi:hypothetical protein
MNDLDALWNAAGRTECEFHGQTVRVAKTLDPKQAAKRAKLVRQLIATGAAVTAKGEHDRTALSYAAVTGNLPVIEVLLEAGANAALKDDAGRGFTPFDYTLAGVATFGTAPALRLLRAGAVLEGSAIGTHASPALLDALTAAGAVLTPAIVRGIAYSALNSRDGKLAVLKWLIAHGADLLALDAKGLTVIEGQFFGERNPKVVALIKSLAKPAPKRPTTAPRDLPALTELGTQLGVAAKKAADDSGDIGYYRREADLDPKALPAKYWDTRFKQQALTLLRKSPSLAKLDERSALETVHAAYLGSWRAPVATPSKSFAKPRRRDITRSGR